jgi:hypothetical protein
LIKMKRVMADRSEITKMKSASTAIIKNFSFLRICEAIESEML